MKKCKQSQKYQVDYTLGKDIKIKSQIVLAKTPEQARGLVKSIHHTAIIDQAIDIHDDKYV
jgi:hypothetical protein